MRKAGKVKITKAKPEDLEAILRLQYAAYRGEAEIHNDFTIQPLVQTLEELIEEAQKCVVLKAVLDGEIVGSVRAQKAEGTVHIGKLMVHPDHQGKGLGKRLLKEIEGKCPGKRFELFTGGKSERNLRLYEGAGYKRFREQANEAGIKFVYLEKEGEDESPIAAGLSIGMLIGITFGILMDNIGLWLPIGLCMGVAVGGAFSKKKSVPGEKDERIPGSGVDSEGDDTPLSF